MSQIFVPELRKDSSFGFMAERSLLLDRLSAYVPASFMRRLSVGVPQEQWIAAASQAGYAPPNDRART